jgi:hypothetical protein
VTGEYGWLETPSPKTQTPEKLQSPTINPTVRELPGYTPVVGIRREALTGAWFLGFHCGL